MQLLKILFLFALLVAVIEAQKGGTKRPKPQNVPSSPSGRKAPQPAPKQRPVPQRPAPQRPQEDEGSAGNAIEEGEGESGPEPPAVVPQTSFTCGDKPYQPGMYADMEVDCSVYHMCFDNRKESFLCGTGTMFNQEILSCDHPGKVNCANSPQFYDANTELGKPGAEPSGDSGSKGGSTRQQPAPVPQPRPRIQPSKTSPQQPRPQQPIPQQPRPQQPRPQPVPQPKPAPQPFADDEPEDEPEAPAPAPQPVPQPQPRRPSKTSPPRPQPRPQPAPQPKKSPIQPKKPIVQSYDDNEGESNVRRAYRARY